MASSIGHQHPDSRCVPDQHPMICWRSVYTRYLLCSLPFRSPYASSRPDHSPFPQPTAAYTVEGISHFWLHFKAAQRQRTSPLSRRAAGCPLSRLKYAPSFLRSEFLPRAASVFPSETLARETTRLGEYCARSKMAYEKATCGLHWEFERGPAATGSSLRVATLPRRGRVKCNSQPASLCLRPRTDSVAATDGERNAL